MKTPAALLKLFPSTGIFFPSRDVFGPKTKYKKLIFNLLYFGTRLVIYRSNSSYKITLQVKILPYNMLTAINS